MPELSIIVPCFNEEKNISSLVESLSRVLKEMNIEGELVLVNDGSTDSTKEEIKKAAAVNKQIILVDHAQNQGIAAAWQSGLEASRGQYIAILDADLQYNPQDLKKLYQAVKNKEADIAQGVRSESCDKGKFRHFLSRCFAGFLNFIFNCKNSDIKSGFLLCGREVFAKILKADTGYVFFQHFIGISALSQGFSIKEVPVAFSGRSAGESFIKSPLLFSLKALLDIPRAFVQFRLKRNN